MRHSWQNQVGLILMMERDSDPAILLGDRGYDSDAIRDGVRARGGQPEIPMKRNRRVQHSANRRIYPLRNRVERFINKLWIRFVRAT